MPSSGSRDLLLSLGIPDDRVTLRPYSIDNGWWMQPASQVDRNAVREVWGVGPDMTVVLFCAKLQASERPTDLLRAFASADISDSLLIFAGGGLLRSQLEAEAINLMELTPQCSLPPRVVPGVRKPGCAASFRKKSSFYF